MLGTFRYWTILTNNVQNYIKVIKFCQILLNIVQVTISAQSCLSCNIVRNIVQCRQTLPNIVRHWQILSNIEFNAVKNKFHVYNLLSVTCYMSLAICHLLYVTCYLLLAICYICYLLSETCYYTWKKLVSFRSLFYVS